ncbi:MAG: hypothetical protein Q7S09_01945 [bacterium]|nr:hypothetical protein [bacterium]
MKLSYRQKAYLLILVGILGIFLPIIPGVVLIILGMALLADKKSRLDVDLSVLAKHGKSHTDTEK